MHTCRRPPASTAWTIGLRKLIRTTWKIPGGALLPPHRVPKLRNKWYVDLVVLIAYQEKTVPNGFMCLQGGGSPQPKNLKKNQKKITNIKTKSNIFAYTCFAYASSHLKIAIRNRIITE